MVGCASNGAVTPMTGMTQTQTQGAVAPPRFDAGWVQKDGVVYHTPHYMATRQTAQQQSKVKNAILLAYSNGPVLTTPKMYIVFWGFKKYGDPDKVAKLLKSYGKSIGGSPLNNIYTQYYEKSNGNTVYITNPSKQLGGIMDDEKNAVPAHPTDSQIATESLVAVQQFGYDPNGSYVVATPTGHSSSGFGTSWCAYHSATTYNGQLVSYTNLPYMPDAGGNCGADFIQPPSDESASDEGVTIVEGHEYGESVTDPNPPTGWYNNQYGEIGDICAWTNIQNDPFGKKSYTAQPMFSNATQSCVHSY
jgi:serine protease